MVGLTSGESISADDETGFRIASPTLTEGKSMLDEQVLDSFGCTGRNQSPDLRWMRAPSETKSYAITLYDPDAPTGSGWWHWVVFDIPVTVSELVAGAGDPGKHLLPTGCRQGRTDFGPPGYGGPCPPAGDPPHHYLFTVYALDTDKLDIGEGASPAMVGFVMHRHILVKAVLAVTYGR
ncbi:MAG: YbhB/YbcL family Raf kinase inhibitor-like protein [Verrucomicrobia bacterium]|nr:YbhB/YbcL family Raf kinase inhibitor-like protein [Verrucomicrobiota bacterium]